MQIYIAIKVAFRREGLVINRRKKRVNVAIGWQQMVVNNKLIEPEET